METLTINLTPQMLALVPLVAAVLQILKRLAFMDKFTEWLPFISIGVAMGLGFLTKMPDPILPSVIIGLVASGGYDLLKAPGK